MCFCVHGSLVVSGFLIVLCLGNLPGTPWPGDSIFFYNRSLDNGYFSSQLSAHQMYIWLLCSGEQTYGRTDSLLSPL